MEINLRPTLKQHEAYEALRDEKTSIIFLGGGAGGGKSWWLCESRLINALRFPGYKSFIGREELKRLMQSTFLTFVKVCAYHKIPQELWKLNGQYNFIEFINGSRIDLLDLKFLPTDPLYERFGSLEYTDGGIEEAGEVDFMAYDVLKTRVGRHMNKEYGIKPTMAITGNPKDNWTKRIFYKPWRDGTLPADTRFIQSLYRDNPHTAESYEKQLSSMSDANNRARLKDGNWEYDNDPQAMIKTDNIFDLWTNTLVETKTSKEKYMTGDIARYGADKTVAFHWEGLLIKKAFIYEKQGTEITETKFKAILRDRQIPYSHTILDEDGIGGGVVDHMEGVKGFVANAIPFDNVLTLERENYQNMKTQCAYKLAENVNAHRIAFAPDFSVETNVEGFNVEKFKEMCTEELKQVKQKDSDSEGKLKIISKEEIKANIGRSPDILDNFIMRMYFEFQPASAVDEEQAVIRNNVERRRNLMNNAR